jgi:Skp family chaperone for outer membrane proteins
MKRTFTRLAALATVGTALAWAPTASAQVTPPSGGAPASAAPRPQRICIVNMPKVLREYDKANFQGAEITEKRQAYVTLVNAKREQVAEINKRYQASNVPDEKKRLQEQALSVQREIEDIDRKAQTELTQLSNDTIVRVYKEIKGVIADIATTNSLDMVLAYPAATKPEEENSPQVAQLMLQAPALMPFYHRGMDITEVVIQTLNARYPSPKPKPITTVGGTSTSPMGGALPPPPGK